jgi:hypothetical protein
MQRRSETAHSHRGFIVASGRSGQSIHAHYERGRACSKKVSATCLRIDQWPLQLFPNGVRRRRSRRHPFRGSWPRATNVDAVLKRPLAGFRATKGRTG